MTQPLTLPKNFDEFIDAKKEGFIAAKEYKENGGKIAGCLCSYTPLELLDAAGFAAIGLCGIDDVTIPDAEADLPKNLCPLIKGTYGYALTEKCPYTYFADIIIGETTCDGKKKMYELLSDLKEVHVMQLPQAQNRPYAKEIWREELRILKDTLEEKFGVTITDDKLREAAKKRNRYRKAVVDMYELQKAEPPVLKGTEIMVKLLKGTFNFEVDRVSEGIESRVKEAKEAYANGERPVSADAKRILLTGCPAGGVIEKIAATAEDAGAAIVCLDDCSGLRTMRTMVDTEADNILDAIADRYLSIHCSVMSPNEDRIDNTLKMVEEFKADGMIEIVLSACHTFNIESERVRRRALDSGIPYIQLETDYSPSDSGQIQTRISAFLEML